MHRTILFLFVFLFMTSQLFSVEEDKSTLGDFQPSTKEPKKEELIKKSLEVINKRISELEQRLDDLSKMNPHVNYGYYSRDYKNSPDEVKLRNLSLKSIRTSKDKVTILNDDIPQDFEGRHIVSHLKFVEYELSGNKIKTIRLVYEKKNFFEDSNNFTKTLTIDPAQIENTKIEETTKESALNKNLTDTVEFKDFSPDTKYKTLKSLEKQLLSAIYKVEILMRHKVIKNDDNANQFMTGI